MAGVRSSKTVGGTRYKFTTLSGLVTRQTWGSNYIEFIYDESGQPFAMRYNGTVYATHPYHYKVDDLTISLGDRVLVPVGNTETVGTVVSVGQFLRIAAPFPIDKMKSIIQKVKDGPDNGQGREVT